MYQIKCDDYVLYDPRVEDLIVLEPRLKLETNTTGEASFTILKDHRFYEKLKKLRSIIEIKNDNDVIFRGRITNDSIDFLNCMQVDVEGVLGFTNDTLVPPFNFPDDYTFNDSDNVVEVLLSWVIAKHNEQVEDFQKLKLGNVTVSDPNNVIVRSSEEYLSTWEVLKTRFFESSLGGYLYVRYEADGNYIDYVDSFELTNTQTIELTQNILDLNRETDASETYSACMPRGAEIEEESEEGEETNRYRLTLESLPGGDLTDDIVKRGLYIYSKKALADYGWICAPIDETTWDDVTEVQNLKTKSCDWLATTGIALSNTITINAVDLHLADKDIQTFRPYRNILVNSKPHGIVQESFKLTSLDIDLLNPQNTIITIGDTKLSLTEEVRESTSQAIEMVEKVAEIADGMSSDISSVHKQMVRLETSVIATSKEIIFDALKEYVLTGDYEEYKQIVEAQLNIMADSIRLQFEQTNYSIENVNGDVQATINTLSKFFDFSVDGLVVKSGENQMTLTLDNDKILFKKNGIQFGWWDGIDFHTGNIVVEVNERAQFGNFAFVPRSDGSLMFLKVGG